jgi:hypothetical protein
MEDSFATLLDGVVKHLEEFRGDELEGFALGQKVESRFLLSHGEFYVVIRT